MIFIKSTAGLCGVPLFCLLLQFTIFASLKFVDSKSVVTTTSSSTSDSSIKENSTVSTVPISQVDVKPIIGAEGNSTKINSTNSNYIVEYKPVVFDSPEDIKTQQEWGGNCTLKHWDQCKALARWFGKYEDPKDGEIKEYLIDCKEEPVVCLENGWTVTRCNLLCMSRCNREIQFKYEKYVSHDGECKAHAHG